MKLIKKTNKNFILILLGVLPVACMLLFFSLTYFISDEVDEKLRVDELRIIEHLKEHPDFISMDPIISVSEVNSQDNFETGIRDVYVYDPIEKEEEPFRELVSVNEINGKFYLIKVRHSTIESKDFIIAIVLSMLVILILMFVMLFIVNTKLSLKLWRPFYSNLNELKSYSLVSNEPIKLIDSEIDEFRDLRISLVQLTTKLQADYQSLKEFTENASHEIQTPLSILSLNLDEILQSTHSEENYKKLYSCYQSVQRLSKLNEKLLLLTKIENNQFTNLVLVDFNSLIKEKIEEFDTLLDNNELKVDLLEEGSFRVNIDPVLANMLIINLISNAIKHSPKKGLIEIKIDKNSLGLKNDTLVPIDSTRIFERFKKGNDAGNSTGLGLSIVKSIADFSKLKILVTATEKKFLIEIHTD